MSKKEAKVIPINQKEEVWNRFAKGKAKIEKVTKNCVIYTRVSSKEQAENNMSLDTQRKACELYAQRQHFQIMGYFGGTYESAKTDERKEFNNMLSFVKKSKHNIDLILVYSVDRFSRTGANAIYIAEQLRKTNISIIAVTQPTDISTPSGVLQQNIQFIFSEYDNQLRREKTVSGMREALLRGEWCTNVPLGYDIVYEKGEKKIIVNEQGKLLRKAFLWKYEEGVSNEEVISRLKKMGVVLAHQRISKIFKNPFYCGLLSSNLLNGEVVEGKQEKVISKEIFLAVNNIQNHNAHGYSVVVENEHLPLKGILICDGCGSNLTGYLVRKKNIHYYKCRTKGCCNNHSANDLNRQFQKFLGYFSLDRKYLPLLKEQINLTYEGFDKERIENIRMLKRKKTECHQKIERVEEGHILQQIERDVYLKFKTKYVDELKKIEEELEKLQDGVSNMQSLIDDACYYAQNLPVLWASAAFREKQKLQKFIFPDGIRFHKKLGGCRTQNINWVFARIAVFKQDIEEIKKGIPELNIEYAAMVAHRGIEPLFEE